MYDNSCYIIEVGKIDCNADICDTVYKFMTKPK